MKQVIPSNWKKHKPREITADQIRAVQAGYSALRKADDPRVDIGVHASHRNEREQRLKWAFLRLGREIASFSDLTLKEAAYLIDYVNDGKTELDRKINEELQRLNVADHAAYFDAFCKPANRFSQNQWSFGGRNFNQLNRVDKIKLVSILVNRAPAR